MLPRLGVEICDEVYAVIENLSKSDLGRDILDPFLGPVEHCWPS